MTRQTLAAQREPMRFIHRCDVLELGAHQLRVEVEGTGFLYRQARTGLRGFPILPAFC